MFVFCGLCDPQLNINKKKLCSTTATTTIALKLRQTHTHTRTHTNWQHKLGLVTTTQVTHASPAGVYAHAANRNWESNQQLVDDGGDSHMCSDIARQLVHGRVGRKLKVSFTTGWQNWNSLQSEIRASKASLLNWTFAKSPYVEFERISCSHSIECCNTV